MMRPFIFSVFLFPFMAFGQQINLLNKKTAAVELATNRLSADTIQPAENVYLQFDKPYYAVGDTIYFKSYITLGAQHKLSALSGILYVDLIGPDNKLCRSVKLAITAGTAHGDFALDDTFKGGNYRIRAYTNWMRNWGETSFFKQIIAVSDLNSIKNPKNAGYLKNLSVSKVSSKIPDVQFLPEGGNLIIGNYSKIAFKATDSNGLGTEVEGTVTDELGNEVCTLATTHLGMGVFNMVPKAGEIYKAHITYTNGISNVIELPRAINNGYTINVNHTNADTLRIRITGGSECPVDALSLVAQVGETVYYVAENHSGGRFFSVIIPENKFPTGIVRFTLFSNMGEPLNERLVFVNNNQLKLGLSTEKQSYLPRQKIKIELNVKSKDNKPAIGSFSVSVTNENIVSVNENTESTILTNLLLTSALKGTIEQPNYYFSDTDEKTNADLDMLMLTQGYRRFTWKQALNDTVKQRTYAPEKSIQISGTVKKRGEPMIGAKVTLLSNTGGVFLINTATDNNGRFIFKDLVFVDSTKFVLQAKLAKGQNSVVLNIDSLLAPPIIKAENMTTEGDLTDTSAYLINQRQFNREQQKYGINKHVLMLKEVIIKDRKIEIVPHSQNLNGSGNADQVLAAKDLEKMICGRLVDCLQGVLTGVTFKHGVPYSDHTVSPVPMAIMIDGNFVDADIFGDLNTSDIEGIEVVLGAHYGAVYGPQMAHGGLIVTTKRGKQANNNYRYAPGVLTYMPKGYYKVREFYSPQYDNLKTNKQMPDLRSTIYWQPDIITDKEGKASFEYFNADGKGTYRIVIEGIDIDGNLGRQVYRYKVE